MHKVTCLRPLPDADEPRILVAASSLLRSPWQTAGNSLLLHSRHERLSYDMDARELALIEQRLAEGYYETDPEALQIMQRLVAEVRRFREEAESMLPASIV